MARLLDIVRDLRDGGAPTAQDGRSDARWCALCEAHDEGADPDADDAEEARDDGWTLDDYGRWHKPTCVWRRACEALE